MSSNSLGQTIAPANRLDAHTVARTLANELVTSVFDLQLRRLEENGLTDEPAYAEILQARSNIDKLSANEMEQLTQLLTSVPTPSDDDDSYNKARSLARQIAVAMIAERQRLRVRLRSSQVLILLRQMIAVETQAVASTERLVSGSQDDQRQTAEQVVESHLDLAILVDQLIEMLQQSVDTNGQDHFAASTALAELANLQTSIRVNEIIESLRSEKYENALQTEQAVVATLTKLLRLLQNSDAFEQAARAEAIKAIADASKRQQDLRKKSQELDEANSASRSDLVAEQRDIADRLDKLRQQVARLVDVEDQLRSASEAAELAAQHLDAGDKPKATERQDHVLKMLEEVSQQLSHDTLDPESLADRVAELKELGSALDDLVEKQAEASELAANDPTSAAEIEAAVAEALDEADDASQLSNGVESQIDEAQQAVAKAEAALEDGSPDGEQSRLQAVENAEQALMEAVAEVQSQLAEAQQAMEASNPSESDSSSESASKNEASSGTTRDSASANISGSAVDTESRSFENEAWFTRLPADLQTRIRASTRRPAPRGYESRLRRYFESD